MTSINGQFDKKDIWEDGYLIDNIFNNLMDNGYYGNKSRNKYVDQLVYKFKFFTIKSPSTYLEIDRIDLDAQTIKQIEDCINGCKTPKEKYLKLDGTVVEVISHIAKQAEPIVLSQRIYEDPVWIKASLNKISNLVTLKWKLMGENKTGSPIDDILAYSP